MSNNSYKRYSEYRANRHGYKMNQIAAPIAVMILIAAVTKFWWVIVVGVLALIILRMINYFENKKRNSYSKEEKQIIETMEEIGGEIDKMKSTDVGYVNKNNQKNVGRTDIPGTDNQQWFYEMECLNCGHKYHANGSDIWQRKCPKCQGGKE